MAVYEHTRNTPSRHRFLASNEIAFEASTECILFEAGMTSDGRPFLNAEKVTDLSFIDLTEWVFAPQYTSPFGIYSTFVRGLEWHPYPIEHQPF